MSELSPEVNRINEKQLYSGAYNGNFFDDRGKFLPSLLSSEIRHVDRIKTVCYKDKKTEVFIYNTVLGYYESNGELTLKAKIKKALNDRYTTHNALATIDDIMASTQINAREFKLPEGIIPMSNGLLDISTFPVKLIPHSPDYYVVSSLGYPYLPEAKCPVFLKFLEEDLPDEKDRLRLQEHTGYLFFRRNIFEKAVLFVGPPDTGKSTFLKLLNGLLGKDNVVSLSLQELVDDKFAPIQLDKKYANICSELENISVKDFAKLARIISGDSYNAQDKFKSRMEIDPQAKLWFSTNLIPWTHDTSNKFFKRWDILQWLVQHLVGDTRRDNDLIKKLIAERSGILNWALEGLERLLKNQGFTGIKTIEELRKLWLLGSSSLYRFINEKCKFVEGDFTEKQEFYEAYIRYCNENNLPSINIKMVGAQICKIESRTRTMHPLNFHQQRVWAWHGIVVKEEVL